MHIDIDPGWTGAVAVLDHAGTLVALYETPTLTLSSSRGSRAAYALPGMVAWLRPYTGAGLQILIEAAQAMPVQGTHSMFQIRFGLGVWLSVLAALALPHMRAWPAIWKRALGLGKEKEQARLRAMPLWSDPRRTQQFLSTILPASWGTWG